MRSLSLRLIVVFTAGALMVGCSSDKTAQQVGEMNKSNCQRLANMYAAYHNIKSGGGPTDEADFRAFITGYAPDKLNMMGIDVSKIDDLFKSERDGKPFKIRYKVGGGRGSSSPVIFETVGVNGLKQVGYTGGRIDEVSDSASNDLFAGKTPAASGPAGSPGGPGGGRPSGAPQGAPKGPPGGG